jgi:hypothetical protein
MVHNKSVNRSWLTFQLSKVVSFVYNYWCDNVNSVGPPNSVTSDDMPLDEQL